jgi:amino acid transporter
MEPLARTPAPADGASAAVAERAGIADALFQPRRGWLRRSLVGRAMASDRLEEERLPKRLALPIFASDALSSVAYATEAALVVLVAASLGSRGLIMPISAGIALLLVIVVASYRQTIHAYPRGGGAYLVARENLGAPYGLVAAAALLVDYVLTVAVSIAAGSLAITSAVPGLSPYLLELSLGVLALLLLANLRGLRESGLAFAVPTYMFIVSMAILIGVGVTRGLTSGWPQADVSDPIPTGTAAGVGLAVVLRAFASGSSALTGVEAIANGIGAFRQPRDRNAALTLTTMGAFCVTFFLGVSLLAWKMDVLPSEGASVLSGVARAVFGTGPFGDIGFYLVQITTFAVLIFAANTAYQGFPRLSAIVAQDGYAPRQLSNLGDRLVFSNGIIALTLLAGLLLVVFRAQVDQLIHLYLLGVFTAFTLSQAGMVRFWWRGRGAVQRVSGRARRAALNAIGALATGAVTIIVVFTKFAEGAWMVTVAVPAIVLGFVAVRRHYSAVGLRLRSGYRVRADRRGPGPVLVVADRLDAATDEALAYARAIGDGAVEVVSVPRGDAAELARGWGAACQGVPLRRLHFRDDPNDSVIEYLRLRPRGSTEFVTVVIPEEFATASLVGAIRRRSFALKLRLLREPDVVITDVPVVRRGTAGPRVDSPRIEVIVPVAEVNDPTLRALDYALSLGADSVRAIHVALGDAASDAIESDWAAAELPVALEVIASPYRDLGTPLLEEVRRVTADRGAICNVVIPEAVMVRRRQALLHNQRALYLKRLLLFEARTILTSVPYQVG